MFDSKAFSGFSVDDIARAKGFYAETLGLKVSEDNGMLTLHIARDRATLVYPKDDHTPATYTILNFPVADIEEAVMSSPSEASASSAIPVPTRRLMRRGSSGGGGPLIAWFKDPAGNVLSVIQE